MKHLSPADVMDMVDGTGDQRQSRHAASCPACRRLVDQAQASLALARSDESPEPSPLFWEQFSARVGRAIRQDPQPAGWTWLPIWRWSSLAGAALVVVAVTAGGLVWHARTGAMPVPAADAPLTSTTPLTELTSEVAPTSDEPWMFLSQLGSEFSADELAAADVRPVPGATDRAIAQLSGGERAELAKLLRAEMGDSTF